MASMRARALLSGKTAPNLKRWRLLLSNTSTHTVHSKVLSRKHVQHVLDQIVNLGSARSIDIRREASSFEQTHSVSLVTAAASRQCHANSIVTGSHFSEIQASLIKVKVRTSSSPGTVTRRVSFARDSSRAFRAVPSGYLMVIYSHSVGSFSGPTSPRGSIALHGRYRTDS